MRYLLNTKRCLFRRTSLHLLMTLACAIIQFGCEAKLETPEKPADTATVSGTVTLNGSPVTTGQVGLYSLSHGTLIQSELDSKGKFTLADPVAPGDYQVFFIGTQGMPAKYMSETSSDYIVPVKESENELTIDIKS